MLQLTSNNSCYNWSTCLLRRLTQWHTGLAIWPASSILVFNSRCSLLSQWFGISALFQEGGQCHASTQFQEASRKPLQTTSINFPSRSPVYSSAHIIYFRLLSLDCFFQADDAFSGHRSDNRCDLPIRQRGCRRRLCIASKEAKKTI